MTRIETRVVKNEGDNRVLGGKTCDCGCGRSFEGVAEYSRTVWQSSSMSAPAFDYRRLGCQRFTRREAAAQLADGTMRARVYRFRDKVVVSIGDGAEVYLDAVAAAELGESLAACAADVKRFNFKASEYATREIKLGDGKP
jgi:hypothetical protein